METKELIIELNKIMRTFSRRSYYNPESYQKRKQKELDKHRENCREKECVLK